MKAATGMWAMSSVILSTWVITLSTLSRYFPNDAHMYSSRKFYSNVYFLPAMITIVQALGTSIPYVCGTKLRPLPDSSFSNVMINFGWQLKYILKFVIFKPVASYVKAHNQSWGWSRCPSYPDLGSKKQIYLQIPISLHWIKLSSFHCLPCGWFLETF